MLNDQGRPTRPEASAAGTHTPWSYDRETLKIYRRLSDLHRRAEPLIMRLWRRANATGMPIARPLWPSCSVTSTKLSKPRLST